jgi:hypothetical protein
MARHWTIAGQTSINAIEYQKESEETYNRTGKEWDGIVKDGLEVIIVLVASTVTASFQLLSLLISAWTLLV